MALAGQLMTAGEVSYDQTTKITGGSAMSMMKFAGMFSKDAAKLKDPVVENVSVKGNRMARTSQDHAEIIDLDAQTVTQIDKVKRQYSVLTFTQMKEAVEQALAKAKAEPAPKPQQTADPNVELTFNANARKTGATKQISGVDTN